MPTSTPEVDNTTSNDVEQPKAVDDKILDLDELVEPVGSFKFQKKVYILKQLGAMGLIHQKRAENLWAKIQEIRSKKEPTPEEEEEYEKAIFELVPSISNMSEKVVKKNRDQLPKLLNVVIYFFSCRTATSVALVMRMAQIAGKGDQLIGENISPDSIAATLKQTHQSG